MLRFFSLGLVREAIDQLAQAGRLTVVVGAGASMEVGLPSWEQLVLALLGEVVERKGWKEDEAAFRDGARQQGLLTTAETVEALLTRREMITAIRRHLYGATRPDDLRPGPLARCLAGLQFRFGRDLQLATTNYDELLEDALRASPADERWWDDVAGVVRRLEPGRARRHEVTVTHLHGILGDRARGTIVLSEGDYQRMQLRRSWQEEWMVEALSETTCLFVGASMTDSNLIRYLYRAGQGGQGGHPHVAVFRRRPARSADDLRFRARAEEAERARWDRLGVTPLFADNFADVAQFVYEVGHRRAVGEGIGEGVGEDVGENVGEGGYVALPDRLRDWYEREQAGSLYAGDDQGYRRLQEVLNGRVQPAIRSVVDLLRASGRDPGDETLGLTLWALRPPPPVRAGEQEEVVVLASSGRVMTTPDEIVPIPLSEDSEWAGVKAICSGVPLGIDVDNYATRWRFVLAFPVYAGAPRLPLGAVTVSTMTPRPETALAGLGAGTRADLNDLLVSSALPLLNIAGGATSSG